MNEIKDKETLINSLKGWVWSVENNNYRVSFPSMREKAMRSGNPYMRQAIFADELDCCLLRLVTRMMFVWAMMRRGEIPEMFFKEEELRQVIPNMRADNLVDGRYYNAILQNLFFAAMYHNSDVSPRGFATLIGARDNKTLFRFEDMFSINQEEILRMFEGVPNFPHPAFRCRDKERDTAHIPLHPDGFSRETDQNQTAFIPNYIFFAAEEKFTGLITLLRKTNDLAQEEIESVAETLWSILEERERHETY